ncbi:FaeA/PapI family transcriptional regulator [Natronoarchaeum sp. GCM10025703]|uniref:FaeA/PapI family transcriptional regulator n=1 Tax=unclassified Natronoarchaeum TaxID=2620183 RepID=UPI0036209B17
MSDHDDRSWGQFVEEIPDDNVVDRFDGAEPKTATEIADALACTEYEARSKLDALCRAGELDRKRVREEPPLTVWYRPRATFVGEGSETGQPVGERVSELLEDMDVPGTSGMMCDWRRDAIRAAFDQLREVTELDEDELRAEVYPAHSAGYDDATEWWEMVSAHLGDLPGVVEPRWGGETWRYDGE